MTDDDEDVIHWEAEANAVIEDINSFKLNIFIIQKLMNADIQSAFLPPWPEWDDAKINAEKWGSEVGTAVDSAKQKKEAAEVKSFFEDPSGHGVLPKLVTTEWRRPKEINPNINYTVSSSSDLPDIFSKNTHILGSDELQAIMLCILFLDKVAQTSPFPIEFQSAKFSFPDGIPWKPWHHIYSNCKIVKGAVHKPEYNNYGKYIVRLFFLGKWRQVTVDDFMPLDEEGRVLLPVTRDPKELWLPILTKAVLKVLLVIDSNCIICSLTGWLKIPVSYFPHIDKKILWQALKKHLNGENNQTPEIAGPRVCVVQDYLRCVNDSEKFSSKSVQSSLIILKFNKLVEREDQPNSNSALECMVCALLESSSETKNILAEELQRKRWKEYRWVASAIKKGLVEGQDKNDGRKVLLYGAMSSCPIPIPEADTDISHDENYYKCFNLNDLTKTVRAIYLFFKPSDFEYSCNILDINELYLNKNDKKVGIKNKGTAKNNKKTLVPIPEKQDCCFGCCYLISDSLFCKTFYLTFKGYCSPEKKDNTGFFIVGESFSWKLTRMGKILFSSQNYGSSTIQLALGSGLQVVRLWYSLPSHYSVQVHSMTKFILADKEKAQEILAMPSVTEIALADLSSQAFMELLSSTESPLKHGNALKKFIESLQPEYFDKQVTSLSEKCLMQFKIIKAFEDLIMDMLFDKFEDRIAILKAILTYRKLFLDPQFGRQALQKRFATSSLDILGPLPVQESQNGSKKTNKSTPDKKSSKKKEMKEETLILDNPKNIISIYRKMINLCPEIQKYYSFNDCSKVHLTYIDYNGSTEIKISGNILFLIRYLINVDNEELMPYAFHVDTTIEKLTLCLIDNNTGKVLSSGLKENNTYYLRKKKFGYTIFAFGDIGASQLVPQKTEITWKLRIIGSIENSLPYLFSPFNGNVVSSPPSITQIHFEDLYYPQKDNIFCRCLLNITKNVVVSFHLVSSCEDANIILSLRGTRLKCLAEAQAVHDVIIPVVFLDIDDGMVEPSRKAVIFSVEGSVVNNSWLLSEESMAALRHARESRNDSVKQLKKSAKKSSVINISDGEKLPSWLLTVVLNTDEVSSCQLQSDAQYGAEVIRQKAVWMMTEDEKRRVKAVKARDDYLASCPVETEEESLKPRKVFSKSSLMSYWSEVTLNEFASSRTETLIEELSKQTEEEEHLKIKKRFSVMRSTDALVEDTYEELKQKIKIGMQIEDYLRDKFENAKASFQYFIDYKNDVFNHVRETTKPKEPQKKERSKKTASKK